MKGSTIAPTFGKGGGGAGGGSKAKEPVLRENASTLSEITENIQYYQKQLNGATAETATAINKEIAMWEAKANAIRNAGKDAKKVSTETTKAYKFEATTLGDIENNIQILQEALRGSDVQEASALNKQIALWEEKADAIRNAGKAAEKTGEKTSESLKKGWSGLKGFASGVDSLTSAIEGNGNAWQFVVGTVDGFISLYEGIQTITEVINLLTGASLAHATAKGVEATAETTEAIARETSAGVTAQTAPATIVANKLEAASWKELAAAKYMAAHAYIPFAGYGIGAGFTAAMIATVTAAGIPAFANGGIVSGPTLAMVGEYGGASNNPEVIAPLNKLRSMLAPQGIDLSKVVFEIKGRTLVGILAKETNITRRS